MTFQNKSMPVSRAARNAIFVAVLLGACLRPAECEAQKTENVILITYDGLRWQELFGGVDERLLSPKAKAAKDARALRSRFWADTPEERREKLLPFFWSTIAKEGQVYGDPSKGSQGKSTNGRFFSYPGYNEILSGYADDRITSNAKKPNPNVTALEWLSKQEGFEGKVAAFGSWDVFPYIVNAERSGIPVNAGWMELTESPDAALLDSLNELSREIPRYWGNVRYDFFTFHGAAEYLKKHKPRVLYVAFGETDDWAHDRRYGLYLDAAWRTDDYIRRLWELVQSMPEYAGKTSLVMTTDHGRGDTREDWTGHSADIPGSDDIWIAVMGPDTPALGIVPDAAVTQGQVAATVAALLGLDYAAAVPKAAKAIEAAVAEADAGR